MKTTEEGGVQVMVLYKGVHDKDFETKIEAILAKEFDLEIDKTGSLWNERQYMRFRRKRYV